MDILINADALTRYDNCTTRVANNNGTYRSKMLKIVTIRSLKVAKQVENYEIEARIQPYLHNKCMIINLFSLLHFNRVYFFSNQHPHRA